MGGKILGLPAPSLLGRGWWVQRVTSLPNLHSFHCPSFSLCMCLLYMWGGLCYLGDREAAAHFTGQDRVKNKTAANSTPVSFRDFP